MSYGPDVRDVYTRAAYYADRILKGAEPAELPVDQVATLKLIVNLRTAKSLSIAVPEPILCAQMRSLSESASAAALSTAN